MHSIATTGSGEPLGCLPDPKTADQKPKPDGCKGLEVQGIRAPHFRLLARQPQSLARRPQSLARQPQSLAQQPQSLAQQPQSLAQQQQCWQPEQRQQLGLCWLCKKYGVGRGKAAAQLILTQPAKSELLLLPLLPTLLLLKPLLRLLSSQMATLGLGLGVSGLGPSVLGQGPVSRARARVSRARA